MLGPNEHTNERNQLDRSPNKNATLKYVLLGSLYFSQGLPYGFFTQALPVLLRQNHIGLAWIGASYLLVLPWAVKFLWSPFVDRFELWPGGLRRSWILPLQLITVIVLLALSFYQPETSLSIVAISFLVLNFLAASQDIATDGLAIDILTAQERGIANGLQVSAYRLGMIASGGFILIFFSYLGWVGTLRCLALLMALATVPILLFRESKQNTRSVEVKINPFGFLKQNGAWLWLLVLLLYKTGDEMARGMLRPWLVDRGLTLAQIGSLLGSAAFFSGLCGALLGGYLAGRWAKTRTRGLILFGSIQTLGALGYWLAAVFAVPPSWLYPICIFDHFAGGMATACLFTLMMDAVDRNRAAADYTFQASVVVLATAAGAAFSGVTAHYLGYQSHFLFSTLVCTVTLAIVGILIRKPVFETLLEQTRG